MIGVNNSEDELPLPHWSFQPLGAIQVLRNAMGVSFPGKKRYEGVRFNVISATRGWVGGQIPWKKVLRNT